MKLKSKNPNASPVSRRIRFGHPGWSSCLVAFACLFSDPAFPADVNALIPVCDGCHGAGGVSANDEVPIIAGQPFTLIEDNLLAFRDGERDCSETDFLQGEAAALVSAMCAVVATLGDDDFQNLAEHYEQQVFVPAEQPSDPALATAGGHIHQEANCELCHSDGGRESNGMSAVLAGQWTPYLERSLLRIRAGERMGPKVMNRAIHEMSDTDITALLNYYARP